MLMIAELDAVRRHCHSPEQQPTRTVALYLEDRHRAARSELTDDAVQWCRRGDEDLKPSNKCWPIDMFREPTRWPCAGRCRVNCGSRDNRNRRLMLMDWLTWIGATRRIAELGNDDGNSDGTMYRQWNKVAAVNGRAVVQDGRSTRYMLGICLQSCQQCI